MGCSEGLAPSDSRFTTWGLDAFGIEHTCRANWSGRVDSNHRHLASKASRLTRLPYTRMWPRNGSQARRPPRPRHGRMRRNRTLSVRVGAAAATMACILWPLRATRD